MRKPKPFKVDALDVVKELVVDVQVTNVWRCKVGAWVLGLAAWLMRANVKLNGSQVIEWPTTIYPAKEDQR